MQWIKAPMNLEEELRSSIRFVEQSRVSPMLGCNCFFPGISRELSDTLALLVRITDGLIDEFSPEACTQAEKYVSSIVDQVQVLKVATGDENLEAANKVLVMMKSVFKLMGMSVTDKLIEFCRSDNTFISNWGMPNHHATFQRI
jgi:hypothetical protein